MNETLLGAIVGLVGVLLGGIITTISQGRQRLQDEIRNARGQRREMLLASVAGLLESSEPQSEDLSYTTILKHVHHSQLLLDPKKGDERELIRAINELAWAVHEYIPIKGISHPQAKARMNRILNAHSDVTEKCRQILWSEADGFRLPRT
jgi:hypothetical protein